MSYKEGYIYIEPYCNVCHVIVERCGCCKKLFKEDGQSVFCRRRVKKQFRHLCRNCYENLDKIRKSVRKVQTGRLSFLAFSKVIGGSKSSEGGL